ncbi:MAG: carbohydrate kinase, partial [Chloroflexi bacterium]|nr:carbohydrate kinase [Chloroflexota bacterium]
MPGPFLLGIDKGTSVSKAVVFDTAGNEIAVAQAPIRTLSPHPGWMEEDPNEAWSMLKQVIRQVASKVDARQIAAIGAAGYMGAAWLLDAQGRETRNGIIWIDQRAADQVQDWNRDGTAKRFCEISGNTVVAGLTLPLVSWLKRHELETLARSRHVLCSKDWVRFRLTGKAATDETDIMWMPGDPRRRTYSDELFELLDIAEYRGLFPEMLPSDAVGGELLPDVAEELGLNPGTPVVVGMGDACAGHYATGALDDGQACTILGTSLINDLTMDAPMFEPAEIGIVFLLIGNKWIRMMPNTGGGSVNLRWFLDTLCEPYKRRANELGLSVFELLDADVQNVPVGSNGVLYQPFINPAGVVAPFYNLSTCAGFFGLRLDNSMQDMLRAVYEGVGLAVYDCFSAIPRPIESLRLTGGGARSAAWCQIVADCMDKVCHVPNGEETTAKGVAMLAGVAAGIYADHREAINRAVRIERTYYPDPLRVAKYREIYALYRKINQDLQETWHLRSA